MSLWMLYKLRYLRTLIWLFHFALMQFLPLILILNLYYPD